MLLPFLSGAVVFGFLMAALFFLRFWKKTRDELFLAFASAFLLLGIGQVAILLADNYLEDRAWAYLPRLVAFLIIIFAILRKNRAL